MGTGVSGEDRLVAVEGQLAGGGGVINKFREVVLHFSAIASEQIIFAGGEEVFAVVPGGANERDAAGEGFKDADGGNSGKGLHVGSARDVHGYSERAKGLGRQKVGEPAGIFDAGLGECIFGVLRIA